MATIANRDVAKVLARATECMRRLFDAGLTYEDLQKPIDDPDLRQQLVEFWQTRKLAAPKIELWVFSSKNDSNDCITRSRDFGWVPSKGETINLLNGIAGAQFEVTEVIHHFNYAENRGSRIEIHVVADRRWVESLTEKDGWTMY